VASDHQAFDSTGRISGVERDTAGPFEEHAKDDSRFQASQGRSNAVVHTAPKRHMAAKERPIEVDLVGVIELGRIPVGRSPQQEHRGTARNLDVPERCRLGDESHQKTEWGFESKCFLDECWNEVRLPSQSILEISVVGEQPNRITEQARGGLTSRAQEGV
jgi:hypothetical protein